MHHMSTCMTQALHNRPMGTGWPHAPAHKSARQAPCQHLCMTAGGRPCLCRHLGSSRAWTGTPRRWCPVSQHDAHTIERRSWYLLVLQSQVETGPVVFVWWNCIVGKVQLVSRLKVCMQACLTFFLSRPGTTFHEAAAHAAALLGSSLLGS